MDGKWYELKATLYQQWGSTIEGWRRQQIARNDLCKNFEFEAFSSQIGKESFSEIETKYLNRKTPVIE